MPTGQSAGVSSSREVLSSQVCQVTARIIHHRIQGSLEKLLMPEAMCVQNIREVSRSVETLQKGLFKKERLGVS